MNVSSEDSTVGASSSTALKAEDAGGKAAWEATPEAREASLRERKAQMILAARKCVVIVCCYASLADEMLFYHVSSRRLMEQQEKEKAASS